MLVSKRWIWVLILFFVSICCILHRYFPCKSYTLKPHLELFSEMDFSFNTNLAITKGDYIRRQRSLFHLLDRHLRVLNESCNTQLVILLAKRKSMMAHDVPYEFRQSRDVLYLTGYTKADDIVALEKQKTDSVIRVLVFTHRIKSSELQHENNPKQIFHPMQHIETVLNQRNRNNSVCIWYTRKPDTELRNLTLHVANRLLSRTKNRAFDLGYLVELLRLIKSEKEIYIMEKAGRVVANIFKNIMVMLQSNKYGIKPLSVTRYFEYECRRMGGRPSFKSVITNGRGRANHIHESMNDKYILKETDWVLLDAGCEFEGYTTDITRTWPLTSGQSGDLKREIFDIVVKTYELILAKCSVGVSLIELNEIMLDSFTQHLTRLNLIPSNLDAIETLNRTKEFCQHFVGHFIGLDVHDTPSILSGIPLQVGMVFTIEPGIYIALDANIAHKQYRGISIRIENMVVITTEGAKVLTKDAPLIF